MADAGRELRKAIILACISWLFLLICLFFLVGKFGRSTTKVFRVREDGVERYVSLCKGAEEAQVLKADGAEVELLNALDAEGLEARDRRFFWRGWKVAFCGGVCTIYVLVVFWAVWWEWGRLVPRCREEIGRFFERLSLSERERRGSAYSLKGVFWHAMALFFVLVGVFFGLACLGFFACDVEAFLDWWRGFYFLG